MRFGFVSLAVGLLILAATACDAEDVTLDLYGPETMASDQLAVYTAELWGGTPVLGPHFPYQPCRACRNQQQNYLM